LSLLAGRTVLVTGGAGAFGRAYVKHALLSGAKKVIVFSRDESKHSTLQQELPSDRIRFQLGDVRDRDRLRMAFRNVDYVIHAAALKQVPAGEYNPTEFIRTNIGGSENVVSAAIECGVKRVVFLSTDKACAPVNLYGISKSAAEKLFVAANAYSGGQGTRFACTRYGNVSGSTGSVIPVWRKTLLDGGTPELTDSRMSRFWMTLDQSVALVTLALEGMAGGEVFIPKLPSYMLTNLVRAIQPDYPAVYLYKSVPIRPGEKLSESLISKDEARQTRDYGNHYRILPSHPWFEQDKNGIAVPDDFEYTSAGNDRWLGVDDLREALRGV
jgi:UDP-N-acetylglucosamine 4,6-dehydratase